MEKKAAVVMVVLLAVLPGIMNMSITAKSDIATLYFQLIMVLEMLLYLLGDQEALWYSGAAFFATWTLKPTAMVFSTAVMGMSGLYLIGSKGLSLKGWRAAPALFVFGGPGGDLGQNPDHHRSSGDLCILLSADKGGV